MAKFTYVGDKNMNTEIKGNVDPGEIQYMGVTFPKGEPVEVTKEIAAKLKNNAHFKSSGSAK